MSGIIIFGAGDIGELAHFYLTEDAGHEVLGFTVDAEYIKEDHFCGVPVIPFEEVQAQYPPGDHKMFIALSYSKINQLRAEKYFAAKEKGYELISFISSKATYYGTPVGDNCFIFEDNTIQPKTRIGANVTLWSGNHIGHHSRIGDHCFISSHVVISGGVTVEPYSFIGVNASIRDHVVIGEKSIIGAGALIMKNVDPEGVYIPARTEPKALKSSRLKRI